MTRNTARQNKASAKRHSKPSVQARSGGDNRVRIIAGQFRGRWIEFPDTPGLRPTGNRIRETLFNWVGQRLDDKICLDLFAGSGALGFEAASRGAARVVLVENAPEAIHSLNRNRERLHAGTCQLVRANAMEYLAESKEFFDLIFVDPPFASGLMVQILSIAGHRLSPKGMVYCEWGEPLEDVIANTGVGTWEIVRQGKAGVVHFALLALPEPAP